MTFVKTILLSGVVLLLGISFNYKPAVQKHDPEHAPELVRGDFVDDYGIRYTINDTLWIQLPHTRFHIIKWNTKEQYLLARNDNKNPGEGGLYTRIDYMAFNKMKPWLWGYCLSVYDAKTDSIAEATAKADRTHPKEGCNGYPFSRMKKR